MWFFGNYITAPASSGATRGGPCDDRSPEIGIFSSASGSALVLLGAWAFEILIALIAG